VPRRSAIGLDIGTSGVRAAQLGFGKGGVTLERFGQVALPFGAVRDGEVVDRDAVARAIKELWKRSNFSSKKVAIGVSNQKVVVRQVDLPWVPRAELRQSLGYQVQDFIPIPVEQAVLDFHELEELVGPEAGLVASSVDLSPFAMLRSVGSTDHLGMGAEVEALVDVGARVTNIVVHQGGVPGFVRILLMGGQDVTDAISERAGLPPHEAEALKQRLGMAGNDGSGTDDVIAARVLESVGADFVDEVRGSLDYYTAATSAGPISRLVLTGGGARLRGLAERLAAVTRVPVVEGRALSALQIGKTGLTPEQVAFVEPMAAVPVGLALGMAS
jgi:type IV pilus assembly protein PilM